MSKYWFNKDKSKMLKLDAVVRYDGADHPDKSKTPLRVFTDLTYHEYFGEEAVEIKELLIKNFDPEALAKAWQEKWEKFRLNSPRKPLTNE